MHFAVKTYVLDHVTPISLERAPVIVERDAADFTDQPVGHLTRKLTGERFVLTIFSPAADHVVALLELGEQFGDLARQVL